MQVRGPLLDGFCLQGKMENGSLDLCVAHLPSFLVCFVSLDCASSQTISNRNFFFFFFPSQPSQLRTTNVTHKAVCQSSSDSAFSLDLVEKGPPPNGRLPRTIT